MSWRKWPDPLIDFGRELYLPWRLANGAVLYRDVDDFYGPLSQYLNAGLVEELDIQIAPLFLGRGMRLFDHIERNKVKLEIVRAINSPLITHVMYNVVKQ